jgi:hypothetical protein
MFSGKPMTSAAASNLSMSATSRAASLANFVRRIVSSGVARRRSTSESARPMVLAPRSAPMRRCRKPMRGAKPSRSKMSTNMQRASYIYATLKSLP